MATTTLSEVLIDRLPLVYSVVAIFAFTLAAQFLLKKDPLAGIPILGAELGSDDKRRAEYLVRAKQLYSEGYTKFANSIYRIVSPAKAHLVVVPPQFLPELKNLPDDVLSFPEAIYDSMMARYTRIKADEPVIPHTIKTSLTPALGRLNFDLTEEVARAIREEMPPCKDWTHVNVNSTLLRIVAIVSGRVFLGPELCHDERYIAAAINYTVDVSRARNDIVAVRPWLRALRAPFLTSVKRLRQHESEFDAIIRPIVHARRAAEASDPGYEKPNDMLQWLIDANPKFGTSEDKAVAKQQLGLSFAAIHTTTITTTNAFYDLAARPEYVPALREEASRVLAENDGVFTTPGLQSMRKLDSFLKEVTRHTPLGFASFQRKVLKPIKLSNGQTIPAGVMIEVPAAAIAHDATPFPNPEKFDGWRFLKLRENSQSFNHKGGDAPKQTKAVESAAHNQFVSVTPNSLTFGYGRHACPGRFFAANEIKMIMARTLLQYDFKLAGGETERYKNIEFVGTSIPNPSKTLLFKEVA